MLISRASSSWVQLLFGFVWVLRGVEANDNGFLIFLCFGINELGGKFSLFDGDTGFCGYTGVMHDVRCVKGIRTW